MGDLAKFANTNNTFLKFDENNTLSGVYKGYTFEADPFVKEKTRVCYSFICPDGKVRTFGSASARLARAMDKVAVGDHIKIVRSGAGFQTDFAVTKLDLMAAAKEAQEETTEDKIMAEVAEEHIADTIDESDVPF